MKFAYARTGGPLLDWSGVTPPTPSRAGETRSLGALDIPRAGAPEIVSGYESPAPGAATIHLGGYMPEGNVRNYGQTMLADDKPAPLDVWGIARKAGIIASAYHGVKRNNGSIWSGLLWAAAAWAMFPIHGLIVPGFALAQGFAQPKGQGMSLVHNPARFVKSIFRVKRRRKPRTARTKKRRKTKLRTQRYQRRTRRGY